MELFELYVPAYTKKPEDVRITRKDHKRFTMRDVGRLEKRINNLEAVTTLSLLEQEIQNNSDFRC